MLKKSILILSVFLLILAIGGSYIYFRIQTDVENILIADDDWRSEVLEFPLIFANDLEYTGEEHIRFAPGWGEADSEDYFSYVFVWRIQENPDWTPRDMETILNTYFDGLMNTGKLTQFQFFTSIPETQSSFRQGKVYDYEGTVEIYDVFFTSQKTLLNVKVKNEKCSGTNVNLVWFYLSPQEASHPVWDKLKSVRSTVDCMQHSK